MAQDGAKTLTPQDLLDMVRHAGETFRRRAPLPSLDTAGSGPAGDGAQVVAFTPRSVVPPMAPPAKDTAPVAPAKAEDGATAAPELAPETPSETPPAATVADGFIPAPQPQAIDLDALQRAAWDEGHAAAMAGLETACAQARAQALEDASEDIKAARDAFAAALAQVANAEHLMISDIEAKLVAAVHTLASKRAGMAIDDSPRPFLRRVEKMVKELHDGSTDLVVAMNPADVVAIKPHVQGFSPLARARLQPDPKLGRGDLRLRMGDITFSDIIAERATGGLA